jgi:hypothetical protein
MHEKVDPRRPNSLHLVGLLISPQDWLCRRAGGNCAGQESGGAIWCGPRAQQGHVSCARRLCSCRPSLAHASTGPHTPCWVPSLDPRFPNISFLAYSSSHSSPQAPAPDTAPPRRQSEPSTAPSKAMTQLPASHEYQPTSYYKWGQGQPQEHCAGTSCDNLISMGAQQSQVSKGGRLPPPRRPSRRHRCLRRSCRLPLHSSTAFIFFCVQADEGQAPSRHHSVCCSLAVLVAPRLNCAGSTCSSRPVAPRLEPLERTARGAVVV